MVRTRSDYSTNLCYQNQATGRVLEQRMSMYIRARLDCHRTYISVHKSPVNQSDCIILNYAAMLVMLQNLRGA
jgi:hypothetical protein